MKWYTAYLHRTEEILACGTAQQVAEALGMKMGSFYTAVSGAGHGKTADMTS